MKCPQGSTLDLVWTYRIGRYPVNLTGYSARMQVRETHQSLSTIISLDDRDGITLGGKAGTIGIYIPAAVTESFKPIAHVYDLELIAPDGRVDRMLEGTFIVTPEVTR